MGKESIMLSMELAKTQCYEFECFEGNIIGDELLPNFGQISALICNFTCEITKLPWQPALRLRFKMAKKF